MKSFLATTAIVLLMGGSAYAATAQFNTYQSKATDIDASKFIGQTVYASKTDVTADQKVTADGQKDWDNIGDINEIVIGQDGAVKAVVIGVGGFLGMGEKNVAVSMKDIKFVKTGDGVDDYSLVINATKEALNSAPAYKTPDDVKAAMNAAKTPNATDTTPGLTAPADNNTAANTTTTTDMSKPADNANTAAADSTTKTDDAATKTAADTTNKPADTTKDQASSSTTAMDKSADKMMSQDTSTKPADTTKDQASSTATTKDKAATTTASDNNMANDTDTTTTASTTNNDTAVTTAMDDNRARLTPPAVTRDGYQAAKVEELTSDKLEGATVYGPKDEDVGKINKLVMNDNGKGVKLFVLDVGGFLGIGAHQIAVTPQELDIVRNAKGDDVRVYIDANKDALKAQPEYKMQ